MPRGSQNQTGFRGSTQQSRRCLSTKHQQGGDRARRQNAIDEAIGHYRSRLTNQARLHAGAQQSGNCSFAKGTGGRGDRAASKGSGSRPSIAEAEFSLGKAFCKSEK